MFDSLKERAGRAAVAHVHDGMVVGLGTGSTAEWAIRALGERCQLEKLSIRCVPTSEASAQLGCEVGLHVVSLEDEPAVNLTIDGADEVAPDLNLVKGLGGALLREKIVAAATIRQIIIIDPSKLVERLGTRSPLPVEVVPFAWSLVQRRLMEFASAAEKRRTDNGDDYVTDNGNFILDCKFPNGIADPGAIEQLINDIPGVVANGLFIGLTDLVIIAQNDGTCREMNR